MSSCLFAGTYAKKFDKKQHRAAVPAKFREILGDCFVICKAAIEEKCLFCYTYEEWEKLTRETNEKSSTVTARLQQRALYGSALFVETDRQGRVTISETLCNLAELNEIDEVFFIGVGKRVEIWNPEYYKMEMEKAAHISECTDGFAEIHF